MELVNTIFNFIYLLSLTVWIGSIVFFSFFVAPMVFKFLEREKAGELLGIIFPRYYKLGYVCSTLILVSFLVSGTEGTELKWCAWGIMGLASILAGVVVNPKAKLLKEKIKSTSEDEKSELEAKFKSLHSFSVRLNAVTLFSGLWLIELTASNFQI